MNKKIVAMLLAASLVLTGCSKAKEETSNDIDSIKLKSNQEIVLCKITAIYGNEIEYTVAQEQDISNEKKDKMPSASTSPDMNGGKDMSQAGGPPDMGGQGGSIGNDVSASQDSGKGRGDMSAGGPPDMGGQNGSGVNDDSDNKSERKSKTDSGGDDSSDKNGKKVYTLTSETGSTTIPVGTDVITSLGKKTTFSRLSNGDVIKMILEKDSSGEKVVVGVWIVS